MNDVLRGVRVLEVAAWTFVPAAGAVLADWGADVIKVEHPEMGDPQRGLIAMGIIPGGPGAVNYIIEQPNRGKRSIGIDISTDGGRELLYDLARTSDVFLTSFLPQVREKLKIDVDDIRAVNPKIIYVRGSGQGVRGPDAGMGGYDAASYWSRGGIANALTPPSVEYPIAPRAAFGDLPGGMTIAGGIAAALFARERTGEAPIVDVSLVELRGVDAVTRHRRVADLRQGSTPQVRPRPGAQPPGQHLPHQGRPVHHLRDDAGRPVLARGL